MSMSNYLERTNQGTSFVGSDVNIFAMLSLASALRLYAKTKMQMNRNITPTMMLARATQFTGIKYKRGEYERAAQDLTDDANRLKRLPQQQ